MPSTYDHIVSKQIQWARNRGIIGMTIRRI
jgi:hypothetical protein